MKVEVAGIAFDNVTMEETVAEIARLARQPDRPRHVCTGNLDHLVTLQQDQRFREIYASADLVLADGMPVVWLSRFSPQGPLRERVAGSDLFWELAQTSETNGLRLFYLGGSPGAADRAAEVVRKRFPNVQICGTYCPSFETFGTDEEESRIRAAVLAAKPDILLVGLGAPKQEKWIAANKDSLNVPLSIGVGGSFEMAAGMLRRAPLWMQRIGMEWSYRMLQEPTRMWRRYLLRDIPFLMRLVWTLAARRSGRSF